MHQGCTQAWAFDEARFGLKVWFWRRWCPPGVRPPWIVADQYQWRWLYLALEPRSGASFALLLPGTDRACLQVFVDTWAAQFRSHERVGVVLDNSGTHRSRRVHWPDQLVPLPLPAYAPELNPVERCFQELRARLANHIFADVADLDEALTATLQHYWHHPARLSQLPAYPWWLAGTEAIQPPA